MTEDDIYEDTYEALDLALKSDHLLKLSEVMRRDNNILVKRDRWTQAALRPFTEIAARLGLSYVIHDAKTIVIFL
jgi:hypothetical protein